MLNTEAVIGQRWATWCITWMLDPACHWLPPSSVEGPDAKQQSAVSVTLDNKKKRTALRSRLDKKITPPNWQGLCFI